MHFFDEAREYLHSFVLLLAILKRCIERYMQHRAIRAEVDAALDRMQRRAPDPRAELDPAADDPKCRCGKDFDTWRLYMDPLHIEACDHARNLFEALIFLRDEAYKGSIKGGSITKHRKKLKQLFPIVQLKADMKAAEQSVKDRKIQLAELRPCTPPKDWQECSVPFLLCRQCAIA